MGNSVGNGLMAFGCLIMLLPIVGLIALFLWWLSPLLCIGVLVFLGIGVIVTVVQQFAEKQ